MDEKYIVYSHHGNDVNVRKDLVGKHREYCLCWECDKFTPEDRENSCPTANLIYHICVLEALVLPVWECPKFAEKK